MLHWYPSLFYAVYATRYKILIMFCISYGDIWMYFLLGTLWIMWRLCTWPRKRFLWIRLYITVTEYNFSHTTLMCIALYRISVMFALYANYFKVTHSKRWPKTVSVERIERIFWCGEVWWQASAISIAICGKFFLISWIFTNNIFLW